VSEALSVDHRDSKTR